MIVWYKVTNKITECVLRPKGRGPIWTEVVKDRGEIIREINVMSMSNAHKENTLRYGASFYEEEKKEG